MQDTGWLYADREEAGRRLAAVLARFGGRRPLVLGIPRGGVPVAAVVARALGGELDLAVARKVGVPWQPELALGAVTADGHRCVNADVVRASGLGEDELEELYGRRRAEAAAREGSLRGGRAAPDVAGRCVIVVDDGLATGATMVAALRSLRARSPARLVAAVPVGATESLHALAAEADEVVCPAALSDFRAVGLHYRDFGQVEDATVRELLEAAAREPAR